MKSVIHRPLTGQVRSGRRFALWLTFGVTAMAGCNLILGNDAPGTASGGSSSQGGQSGAGGELAASGGTVGSGGTSHGSGGTGGGSILSECEDAEPGDPTTVCVDEVPQVCGPDLTTLEDGVPCESDQVCVDGECLQVLAECLGKDEGDAVCSEDGSEVFACGPNLVTKVDRDSCELGTACFGAECVQASCAGLAANCGPFAEDDCCKSLPVAGGSFYRGKDTDTSHPATISSFRLDKYEVTVGRFRNFAAAWDRGWRPKAGAGRHKHLNGGLGLSTTTGSVEGGWDATWEPNVDTSDEARASTDPPTWTPDVGDNETLPINGVNWFEAFAFAIWDGGFLPSEAEWEYAAAGGDQDFTYPWGEPDADCSYANFYDAYGTDDWCVGDASPVGSLSPKGDGLFDQSDLAGNLWEWNLDWFASTYSATCDDCTNASIPMDLQRVVRGGHWGDFPELIAAANRDWFPPTARFFKVGFRVARVP